MYRVFWDIATCFTMVNTAEWQCSVIGCWPVAVNKNQWHDPPDINNSRARALVQLLKLPAWEVGDRGFEPHAGLHSKRFNIVGSLRDREVAFSTSDLQGSNFEFFVWRAVLSNSSHHPQEVLLTQFSIHVHICGLKPHSFHFRLFVWWLICSLLRSFSHSFVRSLDGSFSFFLFSF